jgi:hypothetical protein
LEIKLPVIQFTYLNVLLTYQMIFTMMTWQPIHFILGILYLIILFHVSLTTFICQLHFRVRVEGLKSPSVCLSVCLSTCLSVCLPTHVRNSRTFERKLNKIWQHLTLL